MQTNFTPDQLRDSNIAESNKILRKCVHCGFCTATCPTFKILGDELDSPRGRIYLIKDMLENERPATEKVVKHLDRCLSCLSCMTTCPSGVHYMHLIDNARAYIEKTYDRPWHDRLIRLFLAATLPYPARFRFILRFGAVGRLFTGILKAIPGMRRLAAMTELAPRSIPAATATTRPGLFPAVGERKGRVALLSGCAQPVLKPEINDATIRLLNRRGIEVVLPRGEGCCGSLVHHMGREHASLEQARNNVDVWTREIDAGGLDAILITASGCGTTIKDYGYMLRDDPAYRQKAETVSGLARDITEYVMGLDLGEPVNETGLRVAYHSACSMQHGQKITLQPKIILKKAGFDVRDVPDGHLCCGSAGIYNIMQPVIAEELRDRKVENIRSTEPDLIATGNIGCITQIANGTDIPIVHTAQLLDWAYGGERPAELAGLKASKHREAMEAAE